MWDTKFVLDLVDVVYLASVLGNRPRPIDRHIDYFGEKITVFKDSVDGDQATVRTRIVTAQGTEIPVDYRMLRRGDRWIAYDAAIEGVSLVELPHAVQQSHPVVVRSRARRQAQVQGGLTGAGQSSLSARTSSVIRTPEAISRAPLQCSRPRRYLPARSTCSTPVKSR